VTGFFRTSEVYEGQLPRTICASFRNKSKVTLFIIVKASLTAIRKFLEGWWSIFQSLMIEKALRTLFIVPNRISGIATLFADKYHCSTYLIVQNLSH